MGGRWLALASTDVVYEEGGDAVAGARELGRQDWECRTRTREQVPGRSVV